MASTYLTRTLGAATNRKKFTLSFWFKRSKLDQQYLWQSFYSSNFGYRFGIYFNSDNTLHFKGVDGGSTHTFFGTNRVFRDTNAWYHLYIGVDSTQATESDRFKIYVNGVQETSLNTASYPAEDYTFRLNSTTTKYFGRIGLGGSLSTNYYDGYLAEAVFVDGSVTAHTDYGEFDSDSPTIWKPKDVSGLTFGNNGFHLDFEDSSALGNDVSGNDNDFTVNNLTSIDQSTDTCTNNFATMNPLDNFFTGSTFSEGNLKIATGGSSLVYNTSTIGFNIAR